MIEAEHLSKQFGRFTAIDDVSFRVERGEVVGFLGPNGAGKTTTMRILAGVFPPSRGRASICGQDVVRAPLRARAMLGYFPERISPYGEMTIADYLAYVARMKGVAAVRPAIAAALRACDLEAVTHRIIATLSKGFRQRVGIAQALVGTPAVLILDEPTAGLDPEQVAEIRSLIRSLRGERTVILSTHVLSEVEATCDRVIIIHRGRVRAVDTPDNLTRRLHPVSRVLVETRAPAAEVVRTLSAVPGVAAVGVESASAEVVRANVSAQAGSDVREALARAIVRAGWGLRELRPVTLSLEEIFLSFVSEEDGPPAAAPGAGP